MESTNEIDITNLTPTTSEQVEATSPTTVVKKRRSYLYDKNNYTLNIGNRYDETKGATSFSRELARSLNKNKLSLSDIVAKFDIAMPVVFKWLTGETFPEYKTLLRLCNLLPDLDLNKIKEEKIN